MLDFDYNENENPVVINKYYQIYMNIFSDSENNKQIIHEVERFIAYNMVGETKYSTNFLFNIGKTAANGKSMISIMYQRVLPIYFAEISKDTFSFQNKANQNDLYNNQTSRFIYCDEIDIFHVDIGQLKLICKQIMTITPLYRQTKSLENHSHTYITCNNERKLKADYGLLQRELLIKTKNKLYPLEKYNKLSENLKQNAKIANPYLVNDLDNVEDKIA